MRVAGSLVARHSVARLPVILLVAILAACGGSGSSPTLPTPSGTVAQLQPGRYVLTLSPVSFGADSVTCSTSSNGPTSLPPMGSVAGRVRVTVEASGSEWTARAESGSLELRLRLAAGLLTGTGTGLATSVDGFPVNLGDGRTVPVNGMAQTVENASGNVEGWVRVGVAGGSYACSLGRWDLSR